MSPLWNEASVRVAKVLALHDKQIVIVKQYRRSLGDYTYELPGGRVEGSETAEQAAIRELKEETGLTCGSLQELGAYTDADRRVAAALYFTDKIVAEGKQTLEINEQIDVLHMSINQVQSRILDGTWKDPRLVCAFMLARSRGLLGSG